MRAGLFIAIAVLTGCNNPVYLSETAALQTQAMGAAGYAPATGLYVLPVRRPNAVEKQTLVNLQRQLRLPMPVPWAATRDFDIEIEYSVRNLDNMPLTAFVTCNGGNEFGDYIPMNYIDMRANVEDQTPPPPLLGGEPLTIAPGAVVTGVFREDNLQESALDLEAIVRYPDTDVRATPYEVIENRSNVSNIGRQNVPPGDITPAHVRYQFTVTSDGHVVLDYTIRVRDHAGKLALPTDKNLYVSTAANLPPPVAPPKQ
jgi:hypothetical protein